MSKGVGWVVKLISWFAIYFIFSMSFGGDMPFWAYFIVVFLCVVVQGIVKHFVEKDSGETSELANKNKEEGKKDDDKPE